MRLLVLVLVGCGRIAFDPIADANVTVNVVGELDPTFGGTGIVTPSSVATGVAYDVVAHGADYVVVGTDSPGGATRMLMMAVGQDGSLDRAWGQNGELFGAPFASTYGYGVAASPDGGDFVLGDGTPTTTDDFVVGKLTPAGALDTTFDADGWVNYDLPPAMAQDTARRAVVVNNVAYVCGQANYTGDMRIAIVAIRADGSLEPSFQTGGIYSGNPSTGPDECQDILYDGTRLVATSQVNGMLTVLAIDLAGTAAPTFSSSLTGTGNSIAADSSGGFVIAANAAMGLVARFSSATTLDLSYGAQGVVQFPRDALDEVAIDGAGRSIVVGRRDGTNPSITRLMPDGTLDSTFATGGVLTVPITGYLHAVLVDASGRIVAAGSTKVSGIDHPVVVRVR
jgi:uncharacterized delta-60 repeat protein